MKRLAYILFCLSIATPALGAWGLYRPSGQLTDIQDTPHVGREADGFTVEVLGPVPAGPLTYDAVTKAAIQWQAEIDRLAAEEQAGEQERQALRSQAVRDALQRMQAYQELPVAQRTNAKRQENNDDQNTVLLALARWVRRQAGANGPAELSGAIAVPQPTATSLASRGQGKGRP